MEALKIMTGYATEVVKDEDDLKYEEFLRTVVDPILLKREQLIEQYKKEGLGGVYETNLKCSVGAMPCFLRAHSKCGDHTRYCG